MSTHRLGNLLAKVHRPGKIPASEYLDEGEYPVIDQGQLPIAGYTSDHEIVVRAPLPITIFGDHTRAVKLAKEPFACGADGTQLLYPNSEHIDPTFFYYAVKNIDLSNYFYARHFKFLKEQEVNIPDEKGVQLRIASILSAYDDLIENNRRRIALLEQAARLLYKEWFVHLRFPGHEHTPIIDGVPEGWEKKTAFEVMDVLSGGTPKTTNPSYWDGDIPFFTPKDATDFAYAYDTEKSITEAGLKNCNSNLYPKDTVFITARGTVGKINLAQRPMAMNQSCYAIVAHPPLNQQFLFFALVDGVEQFRSRAVGAVFDAIVRDTFKLIPFVVPDEKLVTAFIEHVSPMLAQIDNLSGQVRNLRKARDLLLPKLMNGEVAV
jgi:type I restriction enzyme S subunit